MVLPGAERKERGFYLDFYHNSKRSSRIIIKKEHTIFGACFFSLDPVFFYMNKTSTRRFMSSSAFIKYALESPLDCYGKYETTKKLEEN